jgi:hypothetical protein
VLSGGIPKKAEAEEEEAHIPPYFLFLNKLPFYEVIIF